MTAVATQRPRRRTVTKREAPSMSWWPDLMGHVEGGRITQVEWMLECARRNLHLDKLVLAEGVHDPDGVTPDTAKWSERIDAARAALASLGARQSHRTVNASIRRWEADDVLVARWADERKGWWP